jgi:hypothetical protein
MRTEFSLISLCYSSKGAENAVLGASGAKHISVRTLDDAQAAWAKFCLENHGEARCE